MHRTLSSLCLLLALFDLSLTAQTAPPTPPAAAQIPADMNQLMRGMLYPAANVVFSSQVDDPEVVSKVLTADPSMATDPLKAAFGGWQAVQNAALTLAESTVLLTTEGRRCSTGVAVPVNDPAWTKFVQDLRAASMGAYAAAQTKNQDKMIEASDTLSANCTGCHRRWRDRRGQPRCQ